MHPALASLEADFAALIRDLDNLATLHADEPVTVARLHAARQKAAQALERLKHHRRQG
jgi:hypothetical protein